MFNFERELLKFFQMPDSSKLLALGRQLFTKLWEADFVRRQKRGWFKANVLRFLDLMPLNFKNLAVSGRDVRKRAKALIAVMKKADGPGEETFFQNLEDFLVYRFILGIRNWEEYWARQEANYQFYLQTIDTYVKLVEKLKQQAKLRQKKQTAVMQNGWVVSVYPNEQIELGILQEIEKAEEDLASSLRMRVGPYVLAQTLWG